MITRGSGTFDATVTDADGNEYDVVVTYKGYSDPGRVSGPPEDCYPPEGEMEILKVRGVPAGVEIPESEMERIEDKAWEHLMSDDRRQK